MKFEFKLSTFRNFGLLKASSLSGSEAITFVIDFDVDDVDWCVGECIFLECLVVCDCGEFFVEVEFEFMFEEIKEWCWELV